MIKFPHQEIRLTAQTSYNGQLINSCSREVHFRITWHRANDTVLACWKLGNCRLDLDCALRRWLKSILSIKIRMFFIADKDKILNRIFFDS